MRRATQDRGTAYWARSCIAIDLSSEASVVLLAEAVRGRMRTTRLPPHDARVAKTVREGGVAVAALPASHSFIHWLETPLASAEKAIRVLPTVLDIQLPFPLEDCVYEVLKPERSPTGGTRALAVSARRKDLAERLQALVEFEVDPVVIDHEGLALWSQGLNEFPPPSAGGAAPRVIVHVRGPESILAIGEGATFRAAHAVRASDEEAVIRKLKAYLDKAESPASGEPVPVEWIWSGHGLRQGTAEALRQALEFRWPGTSHVHPDPEEFLARALATRALLPGPYRCNLRSGDMAHPSTRRRAHSLSLRSAVAVLLSGLLLWAVSLGVTRLAKRRLERADEAFCSVRDRILGYHLDVKGDRALKAAGNKLEHEAVELRPFADALTPSLTHTLTQILSIAAKQDLKFKLVSLEPEKAIISGTAADWDSCDTLLDALRGAGYGVKLERKETLENERVPFTIEPGGP